MQIEIKKRTAEFILFFIVPRPVKTSLYFINFFFFMHMKRLLFLYDPIQLFQYRFIQSVISHQAQRVDKKEQYKTICDFSHSVLIKYYTNI